MKPIKKDLKVGHTVMIWYDPITQKKPEGTAILTERLDDDPDSNVEY